MIFRNKLLDELRENVYKEVASLISANEARPHFLIQLFKDLQKIESDSLRLKILQSVQNILTQSMAVRPEDAVLPDDSASPWARATKQFSSDILNLRLVGVCPGAVCTLNRTMGFTGNRRAFPAKLLQGNRLVAGLQRG